ncbi:hypothetical protein Lal_00005834 [Lupinus albus]|nr:hypothetical protein Lal_00005834 [Lupinus albus]
MQVSACNFWSLGMPLPITQINNVLSRRELITSLYSKHLPNYAVSPQPFSISSTVEDQTQDYAPMLRKIVQSRTRRVLMASLTMFPCFLSSRYLSALALGDPTVTLEEVTPLAFSSGPLFPAEDRIVQLFERNTYSVVNIFDVTLRPQLNVTGVVEIPEGNGSGVVWDEEGHIVTNYHVIGNALSRNPSSGQVVARVNILTAEGVQKNFEGTLVGADRLKDLAVLKAWFLFHFLCYSQSIVDAPEELLRPIKVGQSSSLKVGQQCLAIGNPFGFDHTLTVGVISGLNRDIFSQTGVTIGGGTSAGVGFAIPSSTVLRIVPQLIQFGKVVRAGLNVDIAPDLIANQLNVRNGALVLVVPANSLASKAGLIPTTRGFAGNIVLGDIIVAVDNKPVNSKAELLKALDDYNVGDKVIFQIQRGSEKLEVNVELEEQ